VLFFFISTHTLPLVGVIVPVYVIAKSIGLLDNLLSLVLLYSAMNIPIVVWLLRSFLLEIPSGIREAARIDGASLPQELFRVVLPLIAPGMAATAIICAIFAWNEFFFAVNLTTTQASTVPLFPISCIITRRLFWAKLSAVATPAVLPILLLGWAAQRQMIRGLSIGALD
jgi:sorbitol/mannitol transport system permease protein